MLLAQTVCKHAFVLNLQPHTFSNHGNSIYYQTHFCHETNEYSALHLSHLSVKSTPTCGNLWLFNDRRFIDPGDHRSCDVNSKKNDVLRFC